MIERGPGEETAEAKLERKKVMWLEMARKRRNDYIDEIPEGEISKDDERYDRYKFRGNWWNVVTIVARDVLDSGLLAGGGKEQIATFVDQLGRMDFGANARRTPQEITSANQALDTIIEALESK